MSINKVQGGFNPFRKVEATKEQKEEQQQHREKEQKKKKKKEEGRVGNALSGLAESLGQYTDQSQSFYSD